MSAVADAWLARLDPAVLCHLEAAADGAAHRRRWAPVVDPERAAAELAEMLASGERPAVGWWRRRVSGEQEWSPSRPPIPPPTQRRTLHLLPSIPDDAPKEVKDGLAMRNEASTSGRCPGCGAIVELSGPIVPGTVIHAVWRHDDGCPALLEQVGR